MAILVDTNILLRSVQANHPHFVHVERALAVLREADETLLVTTQNLIEFWTVATRPAGRENGLGLTIQEAKLELSIIRELFSLVPEPPFLLDEWQRLVTAYRVSGKNAHDARLVAVMNLHAVAKILTFNVQDFTRYENIEAVHPQSLGN